MIIIVYVIESNIIYLTDGKKLSVFDLFRAKW